MAMPSRRRFGRQAFAAHQLIDEAAQALFLGGDLLAQQAYGLVPGAQDARDAALFGEGGEKNVDAL